MPVPFAFFICFSIFFNCFGFFQLSPAGQFNLPEFGNELVPFYPRKFGFLHQLVCKYRNIIHFIFIYAYTIKIMHMNIQIHIYRNSYTYTNTYAEIHTNAYKYIQTNKHIHTNTYTYTKTYAELHILDAHT